jgi:hypothetical protein
MPVLRVWKANQVPAFADHSQLWFCGEIWI